MSMWYESSSEEEEIDWVCIICNKGSPPYKCPNCEQQYCSVDCCKAHKEKGPCVKRVKPKKKEPPTVNGRLVYRPNYYPTQHTIPRKNLKRLCKGENLKKLKAFLENPKIKSYVKILDTCKYPEQEFTAMMKDTEFLEFSNFARGVILEPDDPTKSIYENYKIKMRKELLAYFAGKDNQSQRKKTRR